jgi:hypothetical protein
MFTLAKKAYQQVAVGNIFGSFDCGAIAAISFSFVCIHINSCIDKLLQTFPLDKSEHISYVVAAIFMKTLQDNQTTLYISTFLQQTKCIVNTPLSLENL